MKKVFKYLFFLIITIIMILIIILSNDMNEIFNVLQTVNILWILLAFLILLLYLFLNPLSLILVLNTKRNEIRIKDKFMIGSIEYFFNGITPSNTGAQPMQVVEFSRFNIDSSRSTGALLINSTINQIAIVILCLLSLIYYNELSKGIDAIQILIIIGLFMNILVLFLYIAIGTSKAIRKWLINIIGFFCNLKIFKGKFKDTILKFENYCIEAQNAFKESFKYKGKLLLATLTKLLSLIVFYSLPFFILKALNISIEFKDIGVVIAMTTFSIAMTCFIPTPGAAGGIEFAFESLFTNLLGVNKSIAVSGMMLWRFITYYLLMIISLIIYSILEFRIKKNKKRLQLEV